MSIFDLPKKEDRKFNNSIFQKGNFENGKFIEEPDHYIRYRIGHDLRFLSLFFAILVFSLSCLHRYSGFMPFFAEYTEQKNFLGFYLYFINFSGPILFICMPYYFFWFKKHVDFSECNILRNNPKGNYGYKDFQGSQLKTLIVVLCVFLVCLGSGVFKPSLLASIFYLESLSEIFTPFFDETLFVLFVSIFIAFFHSMSAQFCLWAFYLLSYFYYEIKHTS